MRVAILAPFPLQVIPGLEQHTTNGPQATWLPQLSHAFAAESGWDFHWLTVSRRATPTEPIRWQGQTFHCLHTKGRGRIFRAYRPDRTALEQRLGEIQPDLVHTWGTEDCYGLVGRASKRPWLCSAQGLLQEYLRRSPMPWITRLQALYEKQILAAARDISVESHWGAGVLRRLAPHAQIHLVEYGVQDDFYQREWEPEASNPYAVFIGSIDDRKGVQDAVRAFAAPALRGKELRIIGSASSALAQRLQARSTPNVRWLGRLPPSATAEELQHAWCLVLPTRADTSPNVVKEARVLGLPVITTPHGGQSDYIEEGLNGYLVEPGDFSTLTQRLNELLSDLPKARRMGAVRHEEQRDFFRPERTAQRFLDLYRQLLQKTTLPKLS